MRSWRGMKDIKSSKGGKGPIPHLKNLLIFDRRMLKELACVGASVYVCLHAFIWGYCCGSLLFLLWLLGNAQTGQMYTSLGPSPKCRHSHHLGKKKNRGESTKINNVFTGFTVKVSNVLSQGWEERFKAGDVSMTKEVWVSYIKHLLPPRPPGSSDCTWLQTRQC